MQDVAESSLLRHLTAHDADYGCVVLMEVATGEIKAIANLGKQAPGVYAENYNYAVGNQGLTDPGSTFKLASVIALFEDSNIELEDSVETGTGTYEFYDRLMTDSKPEGYGTITFQEAFEKSSNIGISRKVNEHFGLNPQKYIDYIHSLGLADPIGFQMHGEAKPFIKKPTDRSWSGISLPWMSIGYELKISPLQTLMLYNAVANNGKMIKPIIVKETKLADKTLKAYNTDVVREKICSDNTLSKVRKMLEGVVERGTANNINNTIYKIAGKTGTAQKIKNGQYIKDYYCSFAGYFPADKPKYSCIVVIDSPKGYRKYGSDVAAPVFKEIADKIYATDLDLHLPIARTKVSPQPGIFPVIKGGYHEDLNYLCNELGISNHPIKDANEWVMAKAVNNAVMWQQKEVVQGAVPDGTGLTLRDAYYVFENAGLRVKHVGHGRVSRQSMPPGARLVKGSTIYIELE
jgi:cell division protein FtsI (penicillin-binding protein 3)